MQKTSPPSSPPRSASLALQQLLVHAADLVAGVLAGRSMSDLLPRVPANARSAAQAISFYALRQLGWAQVVRSQWVSKQPPTAADALILVALSLLRAALSAENQLNSSLVVSAHTPIYSTFTIVDQAVQAAKIMAPAQAKLVNALLRRYLREAQEVEQLSQNDPLALWNHPPWWVKRLRRDWPKDWQRLLRLAQELAPLTLRVNRRWGDAAAYLKELTALGIAAEARGSQTILLDSSQAVSQLPGYEQGWFSVQDAHAQLAAPLLLGSGLPTGARVLDACSAPGGKTAHLLELADLEVWALDLDAQRLTRVEANLHRLCLQAHVLAADARHPDTWWDGCPFDAILLDAPCSASGIVRRHPDVRWLRRAGDIAALARTQDEMLEALWPLLKTGGKLLYCTCSIFKEEGIERVDAFLQRHPQAFGPLGPGHGLVVADNGQGEADREQLALGDGFYYALLEKR